MSRFKTESGTKLPTASVIYWTPEEDLSNDGGATRIRAWKRFLESRGYSVSVDPLRPRGTGDGRSSRLSQLKRAVIPMPLLQKCPAASIESDLVIATVPAVFPDVLRKVNGAKVILDWMDLWSVNAASLGRERALTRPGAMAQSAIWRSRERRLAGMAGHNVYAGYADFEKAAGFAGGARHSWLPIPTSAGSVPSRVGHGGRVGFIGNLNYPPNEIALRNYLRKNFKLLRARGYDLVVAGYGSDRVRTWGYPVNVLGEVSEVSEFYSQIGAAIVPVDVGGGIKVKAIEAMGFGLPVLGTSHVREGMPPAIRPYVHLSNDPTSASELERVPAPLFEEWFSHRAFAQRADRVLGGMS